MNIIKLSLFVLIAVFMESCDKSADIRIQNNINQVKIVDIKWGDNYIAPELLPGQTSSKVTINKEDEKLPKALNVSFIMTANQKSVFLQTKESYMLDEEDDLLIILTDETRLINPNQ